jgi:peptide/nickel transport system substrate-binding protein
LLIAATINGCDCQAPRGKPWRHEPDPTTQAAAQPGSPALAKDPHVSDVITNRPHTLRVHVDAEPRALNPLIAPSVWARRITMGTVFEPLIRYDPDAHAYAPGLAQSWRIMPDGKEIRFYLQPGVTFHDGKPMTSSDVQFTLDAIRDPRNGIDHLRSMLTSVAAVELITSNQVRLVLYKPDGWVLRALAEIPILPMHVYDGSLAAGGRIVGTGPWQLAWWKDGTVHLSRYGGYWGKAPAIDDLEFVYDSDAAHALMAAKQGEIDVIPELIPAHWPGQANALEKQFAPLQLDPPRMKYLAFDCKQPPLDDVRVRHAIALLLDREGLVSNVYSGLARPVGGPVWSGGPGDGPAPPPPDLDIAQAQSLLADAGWTDSDKDGVLDKGGVRLELTALVLDDDPPSGAKPGMSDRSVIMGTLKGVGIAVEVKAGTEAVLMNRVRAGDFGLATLELAQPVDTDLSPLLATGGAENYGACGSPRIDAALAAMQGEWDPSKRSALTGELAAAIAESWPIAGIIAPAPQGLVDRRVQGVVVWDGWIDLTRLSLR